MSIFTTTAPALCREPFAPIFRTFKNVHFTIRTRVRREWVEQAQEAAGVIGFLAALYFVCDWAAPYL